MPRYMVELVYRFFMCNGYGVRVAVPIPYTKRVHGVEKKFYQFVDVVAMRGGEVVIVECRDFRKVKKISDSLDRLAKLFELAEKHVVETLGMSNTRIRKILVVEDRDLRRIEPYIRRLTSCGIELVPLSTVLRELITCSFREEEYRKVRGEGDLILAILRACARYLMGMEMG